jgi:hypothetical protein
MFEQIVFTQFPLKTVEINGKEEEAFDMSAIGNTGAVSTVLREGNRVIVDIVRGKNVAPKQIRTTNVESAIIYRIINGSFLLQMSTGERSLNVILPGGLTFSKTRNGGRFLRDIVPDEYMGSYQLP